MPNSFPRHPVTFLESLVYSSLVLETFLKFGIFRFSNIFLLGSEILHISQPWCRKISSCDLPAHKCHRGRRYRDLVQFLGRTEHYKTWHAGALWTSRNNLSWRLLLRQQSNLRTMKGEQTVQQAPWLYEAVVSRSNRTFGCCMERAHSNQPPGSWYSQSGLG